jgi:hypothetical protein
LREIDGFGYCTSLCRIEIPSSGEMIRPNGFVGCRSLRTVIFSSESHLREINGFGYCTSLCRIEIPLSVEMIWHDAFRDCPSLCVVIIRAGCRLRRKEGLQNVRSFVFLKMNMKI